MAKTILLTGATDGIGLETAKILVAQGHHLLLHGRSKTKAQDVKQALLTINPHAPIDVFIADLSVLTEVKTMTDAIIAKGIQLDVIINNAGIFMTSNGRSQYGLDTRFVVNTIAPYLLTKLLLPTLQPHARIINLTSQAQMPLDWDVFANGGELNASAAYAQSKLGILLWSIALAQELGNKAMVVAINPKSFLGSKMVKEAYGQEGFDVKIGAELLYRAAFSEEFANASGMYYDNDVESFAKPHPDALIKAQRDTLMLIMDTFLKKEGLL